MPDTKLREHIVKSGECIASLAAAFGSTLEAIWGHDANAELRALRNDPWVLAPGDRVAIPVATGGAFTLDAGRRHVFRRQATHSDFQVTVTHNGLPRADVGFTIVLDGDDASPVTGVTDGDGVIRARLPARARRAIIEFADGRGRFSFVLGALDPLDTISGIQGRLRALGMYFADVDGNHGPYTSRALRRFQAERGLPITGAPDDATKAALREAYGR